MATSDDELLDLIAEEALIDREKLVREATLEDIGLDSVDVVSVVFAAEEKYGIEIAEEAFKDTSNLGQFLDTLKGLIEAKPA
ncbi:MAG TPA: phosphopantetheine-binding protein [Caulobacteraceae bacterium]|jgi:acyl carrier protein|nr:phosphopantetheine-binding protein [Caulobacteraceae bacterium]